MRVSDLVLLLVLCATPTHTAGKY